MSHSVEDDAPNPFNVFIILSIVVVVIIMIVFAILIMISVVSANSNTARRENGPYSVVLRPIPEATQAIQVLPEMLGDFQRDKINGSIKDFKATYKKDNDVVEIRSQQMVNVRAAQATVADLASTVGIGNTPYRQLNADPSYFLTVSNGTVRYVWSHNRWLFDIKANSQAALDDFMKVFKY
jgi:hypothetical protein